MVHSHFCHCLEYTATSQLYAKSLCHWLTYTQIQRQIESFIFKQLRIEDWHTTREHDLTCEGNVNFCTSCSVLFVIPKSTPRHFFAANRVRVDELELFRAHISCVQMRSIKVKPSLCLLCFPFCSPIKSRFDKQAHKFRLEFILAYIANTSYSMKLNNNLLEFIAKARMALWLNMIDIVVVVEAQRKTTDLRVLYSVWLWAIFASVENTSNRKYIISFFSCVCVCYILMLFVLFSPHCSAFLIFRSVVVSRVALNYSELNECDRAS